ncbi:UNVERIFIED_ORG: hypothetical protein J3D59_000832 [Pseudomonas fluorescens]
MSEQKIDRGFIDKLIELEYIYHPDITDRTSLEYNFRSKFEPFNRVHLTDGEFASLLDDTVAPDVLTAAHTRDGYSCFEQHKDAAALANIANKHLLAPAAFQDFVDGILQCMIFDCDQPSDLSWKARTKAELALMEDCAPYLAKRPQGRDISGLSAYEQ